MQSPEDPVAVEAAYCTAPSLRKSIIHARLKKVILERLHHM